MTLEGAIVYRMDDYGMITMLRHVAVNPSGASWAVVRKVEEIGKS